MLSILKCIFGFFDSSLYVTDRLAVFKGKGMPGRMGSVKVTTQNLEVVRVDAENNLLLIKGAVPGAKKALITAKGDQTSDGLDRKMEKYADESGGDTFKAHGDRTHGKNRKAETF